MSPHDALRERVRWGVRLGMTFAAMYFGLATLLLLIRDSESAGSLLGTVTRAAAGYAIAGCVGGALVGALWRLRRSHVGAIAVASIIAFLALIALLVALKGWFTSWDGSEFESIVLGAVIFGMLFAEKDTAVDKDSLR